MTKNRTEELAASIQTSARKPWCHTCEHEHVWNMPFNTFRCKDCGFGSWNPRLAASHALNHGEHTVITVCHVMTSTR